MHVQQRLSDEIGSGRRLNSFAVFSGGNWVHGSELAWMLGNVAVTMAVSLGLPRITQKVSFISSLILAQRFVL
jgi:hypothetical protein